MHKVTQYITISIYNNIPSKQHHKNHFPSNFIQIFYTNLTTYFVPAHVFINMLNVSMHFINKKRRKTTVRLFINFNSRLKTKWSYVSLWKFKIEKCFSLFKWKRFDVSNRIELLFSSKKITLFRPQVNQKKN